VPPFWEDQLFAENEEIVRLQIGTTLFQALNPSQRSILSPPNYLREEVYPNFQKVFTAKRNKTLADSARRLPLNHLSQLNINTRVPDGLSGKILHIGDEVKIISLKSSVDLDF